MVSFDLVSRVCLFQYDFVVGKLAPSVNCNQSPAYIVSSFCVTRYRPYFVDQGCVLQDFDTANFSTFCQGRQQIRCL